MLKEFKEFAMRGNVLDLAIAVIIGGAFGKIVSSFVEDVLMPPLGLLLGKVDFSNLFLNLSHTAYATIAEAKKAGAPTLNYGLFLNNAPNKTAMGTVPTAGRTVAVDPHVIPLGSKIHLAGVGERIAEDTGGKIKGKRLDLFLPSTRECRQFGVQAQEVHLLVD